MSVTRVGDFKTGGNNMTDARSVNNNASDKSADRNFEQIRQKVGTEFTGDAKRQTGKKRNELGKDDFMKLMSAQLKYQDPVNPMKNEQMAAQLAQFSALEQMLNVNQTLEKMVAGQKPSEHMMAATLIGKRVTTDTTHFMLEKGGAPEIKFNLPDDTSGVNLAIVNNKGEVVREMELGEMAKGQQSIRWDGQNGKAQAQPLGEYSYKVSAVDKAGKPLEIHAEATGLVTGVTFEAGKSLLIVDGKKIPVDQVGQIEADASAPAAVKGKSAQQKAAGMQPAGAQAAGANALAEETSQDKQNPSSLTSTQVVKNRLPEELSPEKIKSMLASMGMQQSEASEEPAAEGEVPMPLWNPANN